MKMNIDFTCADYIANVSLSSILNNCILCINKY